MLCKEVQNYIDRSMGLPFFCVVGDADYTAMLEELKQSNFAVLRMSDFCPKDDRFPSVDELVDALRGEDVDCHDNRCAVVGLGEFLALRGSKIAGRELRRLKQTTIGTARVVLLLRGVSALAKEIIESDNKMVGQRRAFICNQPDTDIHIMNVPQDNELLAQKGIRQLLRRLEDGATGEVYASTELMLDTSLLPVTTLHGAWSVIRRLVPGFKLEEELGSEEQWQRLLKDLQQNKRSLKAVFNKHRISNIRLMDDLHQAISGREYENWLSFIYLKLNGDEFQNDYLTLALDDTHNYEKLKDKLISKLLDYGHEDPNFRQLYDERKRLLKTFPEEELAGFIKQNAVDPQLSIWRLTDNTRLEKQHIVKWIVHNGYSEAIARVYPALDAYMKQYKFDCPVLAGELTEYFDAYKRQKLANHISADFIGLVEKYTESPVFGQLPSRDSAIQEMGDKEHSFLYWIDALGVEYLAYIAALAKEKNLAMHVEIARANLPTITTNNKQFYDDWPEGRKYKEERLDEIKHKDKGGYFFTRDEDPIHIPEELEIISKAMVRAATELGAHRSQKFVIVSDHGASRLAVIKKQELKHETDTRGEHSGRCCKFFEGCDAPHWVKESGFICLTDYGRFSGSRAANVEVHGGASLEEIIVPVITLTLKQQSDVQIVVLHPNDITADKREGVKLELFISDVGSPKDIRLQIGEKSYPAEVTDEEHYSFALQDIRRARSKPFIAEVCEGNEQIGSISFVVRGKTAKFNKDFDFGDDF